MKKPIALRMDIPLAFCLLTRLPMPTLPKDAFHAGARAVWAYGLVGAVLGAGAGIAGLLGLLLGLPADIAAGVVVACLALSTGAMHEDGLSDMFDGFWGGTTVERRLEIMRDSQIGTYGTLALLVVTGLRWMAYAALLPLGIGAVLAGAALSRAVMPIVMRALPHARADGLSRSVGRPERAPVLVGVLATTLLVFALLGPLAVAGLAAALLAALAVLALAKRKIGGQTGDVIGATQQIAELSVLCTLVALMACQAA